MRQDIDALYQDVIRYEAERRFQFDSGLTQTLDGFESYVYDCQRLDQSFIMKMTHTLRRSFDQIMGELKFVNYLADHGVPVPRAIRSANGHLVERIEVEHGHFLAYAYLKASGDHLGERQLMPEVICKWGALTGRIHALTRTLNPVCHHTEDITGTKTTTPASRAIFPAPKPGSWKKPITSTSVYTRYR